MSDVMPNFNRRRPWGRGKIGAISMDKPPRSPQLTAERFS